MSTMTVQIRRKGVITLPVEFRRQYGLQEGDVLSIVDLGDGSLMLVPRMSRVAREGDKVAQVMEEEGVTLEEVLETLDEERATYYREHYVEP